MVGVRPCSNVWVGAADGHWLLGLRRQAVSFGGLESLELGDHNVEI